jgi:arginine decarboxylase
MSMGADISIQSTHKMAGSLTQSSMLHVRSGIVDTGRLRANISMVQSTSPSYVLLSSLDAARKKMVVSGTLILDGILDLLEAARSEIGGLRGAKVLGSGGARAADRKPVETAVKYRAGFEGEDSVYAWEPMRVVFGFDGMEGYRLFSILREEYGIEAEFADSRYVVCVAGIGTKPGHIARLIEAAKDIAHSRQSEIHPGESARNIPLPSPPPMAVTPREAWFAAKRNIPWKDAEGCVSGDMIVPYPPGIPAVCPGEAITPEVWSFLTELRARGCRFHGSIGKGLEEVRVLDI